MYQNSQMYERKVKISSLPYNRNEILDKQPLVRDSDRSLLLLSIFCLCTYTTKTSFWSNHLSRILLTPIYYLFFDGVFFFLMHDQPTLLYFISCFPGPIIFYEIRVNMGRKRLFTKNCMCFWHFFYICQVSLPAGKTYFIFLVFFPSRQVLRLSFLIFIRSSQGFFFQSFCYFSSP